MHCRQCVIYIIGYRLISSNEQLDFLLKLYDAISPFRKVIAIATVLMMLFAGFKMILTF